MKTPLFYLLLAISSVAQAQETFPINGVHDERHIFHAFVNAEIFVSPEVKLDTATLIIKNGKVFDVGSNINIPKNSVVHDCNGLTIYPSFIDAYAGFNASEKAKEKTSSAGNWNEAIHPEYSYEPNFPLNKKIKDDWLKSGFGVVNVHLRDGILRGSSRILYLGIDQPNKSIIADHSIQHFSFSKGSSKNDYPSSHMGAIALIRQTLYDAQWNATAKFQETNASLDALQSLSTNINIFELNNPLSIRNVNDISEEFNVRFTIKATGKEYLNLGEIPANSQIILPLNFPKAYDIKDPFEARMISLEELKHWEAAPFCALILEEAGHELSLSRDTLKSSKEFLSALSTISKTGLSHSDILASLTTNPARFLGIDKELGTLEKGMTANFFISIEHFNSSSFRVVEHWNIGEKVYESPYENKDLKGKYNLVINERDYEVIVSAVTNKGIKSSGILKADNRKLSTEVIHDNSLLTIIIKDDSTKQLLYQLSGKISLNGTLWDGRGVDSSGNWLSWAAIKDREKTAKDTAKSASIKDTLKRPDFLMPNKAYGKDNLSPSKSFVITNAVVWTCADTGKLENCDVWIENGKIKSVGSGMLYPNTLVRLDAKGRHLTPGIVDEHSHIGIRGGVNEGTQASSAEVRISDAIDPWNINLYRQLGGGVTSVQLLHGSANPIGGQSALIKLKWGATASEMLFDDGVGFIKFALGENVKRSNSRNNKGRFPLTRMGVEQSYVDAFTRAQEYQKALQAISPSRAKNPPKQSLVRRDLELDALVEILEKKRFISCHSYVQSEILMLMAVADSFNFKVNTFTHILEGYKVANELAEHGASASTFSDWWAYKFEVNDAIPYNAALLAKAGVNTGINSDDAEMGRRLNQEAAKTMKYGGMSEEEALNMITINPAKMLHLDHRVGSIEIGKDADLVLWSDNPLSVYSNVEKTFIEGVLYFDEGSQISKQRAIQKERSRIIAKMLSDKDSKKRSIKPTPAKEYHCDTILEDYTQE